MPSKSQHRPFKQVMKGIIGIHMAYTNTERKDVRDLSYFYAKPQIGMYKHKTKHNSYRVSSTEVKTQKLSDENMNYHHKFSQLSL